MALTDNQADDWVTVLTTVPDIPFPRSTERQAVTTERLVLRPLVADDLLAVHALRTDPAVMVNTTVGLIDENLDKSRARLAAHLPPHDRTSFTWAICLREEADTLIGLGGCSQPRGLFGWPEVGYMLRSPYWGRGLATEFLTAFLQLYEALPRTMANLVPLRVAPMTAPAWDGQNPVEERLQALAAMDNVGSHQVLTKTRFVPYMTITRPDVHDPNKTVTLQLFEYCPRRTTKTNSDGDDDDNESPGDTMQWDRDKRRIT